MLRLLCAVGLAATLALTAFPALAGGWARIASESEDMKLEYAGDKLRMAVGGQGEDAYMLFRDGRVYTVSGEMVFDAGQMIQRMGGEAKAPGNSLARFHALEPTERSETVAGISGKVHTLDFTDDRGRRQQKEVVLSGDARVVALQEAFLRMTRTMAEATSTDTGGAAELEKALGGRGILRMGNEMRVAEISGDTPPESRFELPAEPQSLDGMLGN